jgi:mRNA-degrading endonuclease RelE of RelBE toxin-antitoxin system
LLVKALPEAFRRGLSTASATDGPSETLNRNLPTGLYVDGWSMTIVFIAYLVIGLGLCFIGRLAKAISEEVDDARHGSPLMNAIADRPPVSPAKLFWYRAILSAGVVLLWPAFLFGSIFQVSKAWLLTVRTNDPREDREGVLWVGDRTSLREHLLGVWDPAYFPLFYSRSVAEWSVGLAPPFRKAVATLDKRLQGRVLEAITSICDAPLTPQGDTKKPLEGDMKGLWRYRIGDFRLIYRSDASVSKVVLLDFVRRGDAY